MKLERHYVEKPWGQMRLPAMFAPPPPAKRIGEVWFTGSEFPLLVKYLFTSERLSIQVHPSDEQALARGLPRGKAECWYVLEAEADATIGLGLVRPVGTEELLAAAREGSIVQLMNWCPVAAGDFLFVPAGTIHAIGGGISLVEIQQNSDVTYRLYDYGRPRELHVEDAVAVATLEPYPTRLAQHLRAGERRTIVDGPQFTVVHSDEDALMGRRRLVIPIEGEAKTETEVAGPGECLLLAPGDRLVTAAARMLIAASL